MEITIKSGHAEKQRSACLVAGVYEPRRMSETAKALDEISEGYLSSLLRRGDLEGKVGQTLILHSVPGVLADRVLLVGCGKERELGDRQYRKIIHETVKTLNDMGALEAVCYLPELNVKGRDNYWKMRLGVESTLDALYRFDKLKTKKDVTRRPLRKLVFGCARKDLPLAEQALREAQAIANGVKTAKDLVNLPPNLCTPTYLAEHAQSLCNLYPRVSCEVLDEDAMRELKMETLLAVARGSREPAKLVQLTYQGSDAPPIVLVGKGVTFDAGGISLKPAQDMDHMKNDMGGAAAVMGALTAVADLQLPLHVIGLMPCTENLPDGHALKPADIITSMSGQTIEILNTDAEGRLILCDTLTYAERFEPQAVIDVATLTGAIIVALGGIPNGLIGNHSPLIHELIAAGKASDDRVWELPLWDEYQEALDSNFADMANVGPNREAGALVAAAFLSRFTRKYSWAHLDIAGTAWKTGKEKGATGRPVPLLMQYLLDSAARGEAAEDET